MKKFNSNYNGLLPIYLNDIRFMQQCYDEQIEALIAPYCEFTDHNSFILSGCEIYGPTYSQGWLVLNGKIYRCPGGSTPTPDASTEVIWSIKTINLTGGAKTPKRVATTVETWQEDIATLKLGIHGGPNNIPALLPKFSDFINLMNDTGWVNIVMSSGWTYSWESRPQIRVRNGVAYLRGFVTRDGSTTGVIGLVPTSFRPSRDCVYHDGSISISTSGNITETELNVENVSLDDIMWVI